jgi:hypothetical protein
MLDQTLLDLLFDDVTVVKEDDDDVMGSLASSTDVRGVVAEE